MSNDTLDLGSGYSLRWLAWSPERDIEANRVRYEGVEDVERYGAIIVCPHTEGAITFASDTQRAIAPERNAWTVESWEPLTLSPSILRRECGCHGFIRDGQWVAA